jgi:hypothetical protein
MQYYQLPLIFCSAKVITFPVVAKNDGRKMMPSSFIYVVLAMGQDPGRTEQHNVSMNKR